MDDTISRQAAIDELEERVRANGYTNTALISELNRSIGYILNLPSAEKKPKTGKWIKNNNGTWSCSACQSWIPGEQRYYARYCLHCGAKMKNAED